MLKDKLSEELTSLYLEEKTGKIAMISSRYKVPFHEAEDIYQKAFIKAFNGLDKFKGESSLKTWIFRIVHNTFLDLARKSSTKTERNMSSLEFAGDDDSNSFLLKIKDEKTLNPSELHENQDINKNISIDIEKTLEKLSAQHKKVIDLVFKKGYSYDRAAKTMKCSVGTIMSRVFYARKNFVNNYSKVKSERSRAEKSFV